MSPHPLPTRSTPLPSVLAGAPRQHQAAAQAAGVTRPRLAPPPEPAAPPSAGHQLFCGWWGDMHHTHTHQGVASVLLLLCGWRMSRCVGREGGQQAGCVFKKPCGKNVRPRIEQSLLNHCRNGARVAPSLPGGTGQRLNQKPTDLSNARRQEAQCIKYYHPGGGWGVGGGGQGDHPVSHLPPQWLLHRNCIECHSHAMMCVRILKPHHAH